MPKELEHKLMMAAKKKGFGKERTGKYVYGIMHKMGMMDEESMMSKEIKKRAKKKK